MRCDKCIHHNKDKDKCVLLGIDVDKHFFCAYHELPDDDLGSNTRYRRVDGGFISLTQDDEFRDLEIKVIPNQ